MSHAGNPKSTPGASRVPALNPACAARRASAASAAAAAAAEPEESAFDSFATESLSVRARPSPHGPHARSSAAVKCATVPLFFSTHDVSSCPAKCRYDTRHRLEPQRHSAARISRSLSVRQR